MNIQWFPGHMTRARREIEQKLKWIDLVIELLDARIPLSSRNPMIDQIVKAKPRLILLNKADLADPACTTAWIDHFQHRFDIDALPIDSTSARTLAAIVPRAEKIMAAKREVARQKGMNPRALRALIVGIPNVGKSTLINRLAGRNVAAVGDRPGMTKGQQWIKVGNRMELLDTPGILWPKFEDPHVGVRLAATGAIREEVLPLEEVAFHTLAYLLRHYSERVKTRYELDRLPAGDNPQDLLDLLEQIGRKRGCLQSGGQVDLEKASGIVLKELRSGKLGRISLEWPKTERTIKK